MAIRFRRSLGRSVRVWTVVALAVVALLDRAFQAHAFAPRRAGAVGSFPGSSSLHMSSSSLVVISPPGGVGEVTAVKAAEMGSSVRWFVVSSPSSNEETTNKVALSQYTLDNVERNGGSVELAGADCQTVLEDSATTLQAIATWCASADGLVCTNDGVDQLAGTGKIDEQDPKQVWKNAIAVAAQRASQSIRGRKVVVLPADEDDEEEQVEQKGGFLQSFLGGDTMDIPSSLSQAMGESNDVVTIRHGSLFGIPESSPNFSALTGGPLKEPMLCEEYTMRSVRMDPSLSLSGSAGLGSRSSRHAIGEAAALLVRNTLNGKPGLDVCVTSLRGTDPITLETWEEELERVQSLIKSGEGAPLFTTSFASVPDVERLADWLATKWAPAVMRTYDIAAIRIGARPVFATRPGEGIVEIVWQQLENFESVTAAKMLIKVSNDGIVATRAAGDASKGYGTVSRKPLAGENVLVSKLADAASQAIEKGLAKKAATAKTPAIEMKEPVKVSAPAVTSVTASGTVEQEKPSLASGPRTAGARRSSERARGSRRKKRSTPPPPAAVSDEEKSFE